MKKLLLTLSAAAICTSAVFAEETILTKDATDIQGTYVAATSSAGEHYQPLESLKLGAYSLTFSPNTTTNAGQQPAYYTGDNATIRVYLDNSITITNADVNLQKVVLNCKSIAGVNADNNLTVSEGGSVEVNTSAKTITWTRPETEQIISTLTLRLPDKKDSSNKNPNVQISSLTFVKVGESETPPTPPAEVTEVASIDEIYALGAANPNINFKTLFPMTVTYVNGINTYVHDGFTASLIYGSAPYKKGDVIPAGLVVNYAPYAGLPELKPAADFTMPAASGSADVVYETVELANISMANLNEIFTIPNVTFESETPATKTNFNGTSGDATAIFRNNFLLESQLPGVYNVVAVVSCYNADIQLLPIAYEVISVITPPEPTTGITIYKGLIDNADDFTFVNDVMPEDISYVWSWANNYGIKASGYVSGTRYTTKSWAMSPVIDLTNYENIIANFEQAANFFNNQETFLQMCSTWIRVEGDEWEDLTPAALPAGTNWTYVGSGDIDLKKYDGKKIQFGFYYTSSQEQDIAGTWEIKNLYVKGDKNTSVEGIAAEAPAEYFDLQGRRIANPAAGIFIKRQGDKVSKVVVK